MRRRLIITGVFLASAGGTLLFASCSDSTDVPPGPTQSSTGQGGEGGSAGGTGTGGDLFTDAGDAGCVVGQPCGDGGVCTGGGVCCDAELGCGSECCSGEEICSFQQCAVPGGECYDSSDCPLDEYCEYSLGEPQDTDGGAGGSCQGGVVLQTGKCMPRPPECDPGEEPGDPPTCLEKCEHVPPTSAFDPVLNYSWGGMTTYPYSSDVMMTPIVIQLDDDDCDGKITERDIPEIAFSTFTAGGYYRPGTLHVISIMDGAVVEKWNAPDAVHASTGLAAGDLNGDGTPEIVACLAPAPGGTSCCDAQAYNTGVIAFNADGTTLWTQTDTTKVHCGYEKPALADPNHTGQPLVLVGWTLLDGQTGAIVQELEPATSYGAFLTGFADLDGDSMLEVVGGQRAYRTDGAVMWDLRNGPDAITTGYHAVGDLNNDGQPEVVVVSSSAPHAVHIVRYNPLSPTGVDVIRRNVDINNGISTAAFCGASSEYGGGPPTIADFNGDGFPDVGTAGAVGYIVLDGQKLMDPTIPNDQTTLWFQTTQDCSSAVTGSAVFDFNGDGMAEVVYSDEVYLWMYDGTTGVNLIPSTCNTTGTLWEYPVIADVDNDGQADIIVGANAYALSCNGTKQSGISIFGSQSSSWVRTRRVWNQHTYHVTNIAEDGSIPQNELPNWTQPGLNNYRQNKQPGGEFAAPDLTVSVFPRCAGPYALVARVRNIGEAAVEPGIPVGFYLGEPSGGNLLGTVATTVALFSLGTEDVILELPQPPPGFVTAVVDDGSPPHSWVECRTDNNQSALTDPQCQVAR